VSQLNLRLIVFIIFLLNFIGVLIGVASIPSSVGQAMSLGERLLLINSVVTSFALVLLSYWVWQDGEKL
jgi:hypothetical protein